MVVRPEALSGGANGENMVDSMSRAPYKFDPERAERSDCTERQEFLPNEKVLDLIGLRGDETMVDYGAGSGTLTVLGVAGVSKDQKVHAAAHLSNGRSFIVIF